MIAAGTIGQDVSSGVLQLLFARPVRRSEYVLSRWIGIVALVSARASYPDRDRARRCCPRAAPRPIGGEALMMVADNTRVRRRPGRRDA